LSERSDGTGIELELLRFSPHDWDDGPYLPG
jgi:hypothetical protein